MAFVTCAMMLLFLTTATTSSTRVRTVMMSLPCGIRKRRAIQSIFLRPTFYWKDTLPDLPLMAESAADGCRYELEIIDTDPGLAFWRCDVYAVKRTTNNLDKLHRIANLYFDIESSDRKVHAKPAPGPLDPASVEWLQTQLRQCDYHCGLGKPEVPFLPTRLIHVGQNEDDAPRLVIVENMLESGMIDALDYATLSYCWGSKEDALKQTKTTKDTILTHCQGMPLDSLSPVIRDTIKVCRALGIFYLWVDALCIIQEDNVDWDRESQMVGQIYHSCYVTICPLSSQSCLEGYLGPRPQGLEVEFQSSRHEHIRGTYRLILSSTNIYADILEESKTPVVYKDLERSAWDRRGWTFQESILSPRMILFGPNMGHFVCENLEGSENGHIDRNKIHGQLQIMIRKAIGKPYEELDRSANTRADVYSSWSAVHEVQERAWTYREDIFPGIAGIAQVFATLTSDTYLAGLWKDDLSYQLLWYMPEPPPVELASLVHSLQHAEPYIAPSWSWASRATYKENLAQEQYESPGAGDQEARERRWGVRFVEASKWMPCHNRPDFALIDYHMDSRGSNIFGLLTGGFLRFKGRTCPFPSTVRREAVEHIHSPVWFGKFSDGTGICMLDYNISETLVQAPESMRLFWVSSCCSATLAWRRIKFFENCIKEDLDEWMQREVEVSGTSFPNGYEDIDVCRYCADPTHKRTRYGLVIHPAEEPGSYVRVGVFMLFAHKGGMDLFKGEAEEIKLI
ncbi:hypothetical protein CSPX01_15605 [Colletotrichum filicis]|nr:hypothetical protein CSPX01_15605 [Colletotrichum filicis]